MAATRPAHRVALRRPAARSTGGSARPTSSHGTNFVVPPTAAAAVVTIHDLTYLRFPEMCTRRCGSTRSWSTGPSPRRRRPHRVGLRPRRGARALRPAPRTGGDGAERRDRARAGDARGAAGPSPAASATSWRSARWNRARTSRAGRRLRPRRRGGRRPAPRDRRGRRVGRRRARRGHRRARRTPTGSRAPAGSPRHARADLLAGALSLVLPSRYEGFGLPPSRPWPSARRWSPRRSAPSRRSSATPRGSCPGRSEALATAIASVVTSRRGAGAAAAAGRARAATFSWERTVDGLAVALGRGRRSVGSAADARARSPEGWASSGAT